MASYVFYDTETTGILTAFDQILQFGAIGTDEEFNELDRLDVRCRLMPLEVTGVTPEMLINPALPSHYEAMRKIHAALAAWSPAIFIGFNSISFDEPLLRQAFYQTLQPIYLTNTGGNARADVLRMVHAASVYAPNTLSVPIGDNGRQIFRLDQLSPANG
jgi:exodeoxyribonuclease-1